ncbi:PstA family ABC transporter permease [Saccharicrinis fermentans]|uniref:Phosphate transport system permease protein PstA n=1 Tax=Saccharicrinis fermentans DSM 9555 = JCM 21142 TaxID=869213 RepID=W7Y4D8_9BACT|nr:ABC transporter permease subunit [Saccharicrinis fermentans]GAF02962.1 phosphate transport system permease protein PstA [Saccharicrinis fermentans DSM 9555 = JCM 21142]
MNNRKQFEEKIVRLLSGLATLSLVTTLIFIIVIIFMKGLHALSWTMLFMTPRGGYYYGGEGGVLNALIGSLYISFGATILATIMGVPSALYINVYLSRYKKTQNIIRYVLDALWGVPSIVYGAFGFALMLLIGINASLLAGIITVALLITPIVVRTFDEALCNIPKGLYEASLALGSTRSETAFKVIFKQGFPGFITALLLAFGRGIGDAASVIFTAGYTDLIPIHLDEPPLPCPYPYSFS